MAGIEDFINAIGNRLGSTLQGASPFQGAGDRLGGFSPFSGAGLLNGRSPFPNGLTADTPFKGGQLGIDSPFQGRGFNVPTPFSGTLTGGTPFGGNPFDRVVNPYAPKPPPGPGQPGYNPYAPGTTGGGQNWDGPTSAADNRSLTAEQIDKYVAGKAPNSPLVGMGAFILAQANAMGVSVPQLLGIMTLESGLGTNGALNQFYNYGGLTGKGWGGQTGNTAPGQYAREFATFASKEDGIKALMANLASDLYRGKTLRQQTGLWYLGNENAGLDANDEQGNASLQQYLSVIQGAYQGLGVNFNPNAGATRVAGGAGGQAGVNGVKYSGQSAVQRAESLKGTPYVLGGLRGHPNQPNLGLDCSEFTGWALGLDQSLWHAQTQYDKSQHLSQQDARAGDLVFFTATDPNNPNEYITHVGLYLGNGRFINSQDGGVMEADLNSSYWRAHLAGFGRL